MLTSRDAVSTLRRRMDTARWSRSNHHFFWLITQRNGVFDRHVAHANRPYSQANRLKQTGAHLGRAELRRYSGDASFCRAQIPQVRREWRLIDVAWLP